MKNQRGTDATTKSFTANPALLEVGNREIWQLKLVTRDHIPCGRIVRQLVEPEMYTIRYLIVYDPETGRRVPLPANTVTEITNEAVFCNIDALKFLSLPNLNLPLSRAQEEEIYGIIEQTPYWVEEAAFLLSDREPESSD
ncbi:MAG TPA: hypothetical protein GXX47_02090 [Firmicutes bacterium]|nr:hypothetical protein [Bacillota bacterium]